LRWVRWSVLECDLEDAPDFWLNERTRPFKATSINPKSGDKKPKVITINPKSWSKQWLPLGVSVISISEWCLQSG